jgi:cell division protein ZapA (FtsZ GTPase activity inhibitor)
MSQPTHRTRIAGLTLDLPVHGDPEETERLAEEVTARVREIEAASTRIDTQAFALKAALSFAAELREAKAAHDADTAEILKALDAILTRLEDIVATDERP